MSALTRSLVAAPAILVLSAAHVHAWQQPFFVISYWHGPPVADAWYQGIADCNFNLVFNGDPDLAAKYGMKCMVADGRYSGIKDMTEAVDAGIAEAVGQLKDKPNLFGYYLVDEPSAGVFPNLGHVTEVIRKLDPEHPSYVNLYPDYCTLEGLGTRTYEEHVDKFCKVVKPDLLSYDHYALFADGNIRPSYFANMEVIRRKGLEYGIPFWFIFLATPHFGYADPTEGQLRWQAYTAIAYGAKGLMYFTYYWVDDAAFHDALISKDGTRNRKWFIAKRMNEELGRLGPTLLRLTSEKVYHTGGDVPEGASGLPGDAVVRSADAKLVIGELRDRDGTRYLMVTNGRYDQRADASLTLASDIRGACQISKRTGQMQACHLLRGDAGPILRVRLAPGDGRLYALGSESP